MQVRIFQPQCYGHGVRRCVAHGLYRNRFHSTRRKVIDTMWRNTWQRLARPTSRCDVAVTNGHRGRAVLPHTRPETQKFAVWKPAVHWAKHFFYQIAWIWTWLTCHLGRCWADSLPSSKFLLSWQNKEGNCQSMAETTAWPSRCQFITFLSLFICG